MIDLHEVCKSYPMVDGSVVPVLRNITLQVRPGEFVAIMGASGSGKSTLMNIIGCLDTADSGRCVIAGREVSGTDSDTLAELRSRYLGFVFQSFNLIPRIDALRNVELPMVYAGITPENRRARAMAALQIVGLDGRAHHTPSQLSGGQQQRVALARALVNDPALIVADEPTGSLDPATTRDMMNLFVALNASGKTIVMVTHEHEVAAYAHRIISLAHGQVATDEATA